jgi:hypothetical protein
MTRVVDNATYRTRLLELKKKYGNLAAATVRKIPKAEISAAELLAAQISASLDLFLAKKRKPRWTYGKNGLRLF